MWLLHERLSRISLVFPPHSRHPLLGAAIERPALRKASDRALAEEEAHAINKGRLSGVKGEIRQGLPTTLYIEILFPEKKIKLYHILCFSPRPYSEIIFRYLA